MQPCPKCKRVLSLESYPPSSRGRKGSWCRACHREKVCGPPTERACDGCGDVLTVTVRRAAETWVFCSRPCKDKEVRQKRERLQSKPERNCVHCGVAMPKAMRADARFCSEACNSAAHKLKRKGMPRREILRAYIIERDRSICHLCGKKVEPGEIHLDHVIPLSLGGAHDETNIRVSHAFCNLSKHARPMNEQLALVG